jgi:hypothetical protein
VEKYCKAWKATDYSTTHAVACWIPKAINTHSEYVILTACLMQMWLRELACMLRHTYIACLALYFLHSLLSIAVTECNQTARSAFLNRSFPAGCRAAHCVTDSTMGRTISS